MEKPLDPLLLNLVRALARYEARRGIIDGAGRTSDRSETTPGQDGRKLRRQRKPIVKWVAAMPSVAVSDGGEDVTKVPK